MEESIEGTAAGVPFVALPPDGVAGRAPMIAAWHPTADPGSPAAMAAALPLRGVPAWRVYFGLPGTGSRPAERVAEWDLLLDGLAPMVEGAAGMAHPFADPPHAAADRAATAWLAEHLTRHAHLKTTPGSRAGTRAGKQLRPPGRHRGIRPRDVPGR